MTDRHWEAVYHEGDTSKSWYQEHATVSLSLIRSVTSDLAESSVLDVGGGASTLVDDLIAANVSDISVLDVSERALELAQARLGDQASAVSWIHADLLQWQPERTYSVWHDRAVLHFLVKHSERRRYREVLLTATSVGSVAVIGVFSEHGPTKCSGLDVQRFSIDLLVETVGPGFELVQDSIDVHTTPAGVAQEFRWGVFRRR